MLAERSTDPRSKRDSRCKAYASRQPINVTVIAGTRLGFASGSSAVCWPQQLLETNWAELADQSPAGKPAKLQTITTQGAGGHKVFGDPGRAEPGRSDDAQPSICHKADVVHIDRKSIGSSEQ